jgi:hypothetical protein
VESSNPILTAAHGGASTGKLGTCNQLLRMSHDAVVLRFPDSIEVLIASHIRVLQVGTSQNNNHFWMFFLNWVLFGRDAIEGAGVLT